MKKGVTVKEKRRHLGPRKNPSHSHAKKINYLSAVARKSATTVTPLRQASSSLKQQFLFSSFSLPFCKFLGSTRNYSNSRSSQCPFGSVTPKNRYQIFDVNGVRFFL